MLKKHCFLILALLLSGCASRTLQSETFMAEASRFKPVSSIAGVPFIAQSPGYCGPSTLSMALRWAGKSVTPEELAAYIYNKAGNGSLPSDMLSAARRQGFLAMQIQGFSQLISELQAGHPVIIFENLGISWLPQWHYALVTGYNLQNKTLTMHSGPTANLKISLSEFELSWKLADYWGLVVLPPDELAASASELSHLQAAAKLEQLEQLQQAETAYLSILRKWNKSYAALIGLGNVYFKAGSYEKSIRYLKQAVALNPDNEAGRRNLLIVESLHR